MTQEGAFLITIQPVGLVIKKLLHLKMSMLELFTWHGLSTLGCSTALDIHGHSTIKM